MTRKYIKKISNKKKKYYRRIKNLKTRNNKNKKNNFTYKNKYHNYNLVGKWEKVFDKNINWQKIELSATGKYQNCIVRSKLAPVIDPEGRGNLYNSYDFGNTWIPNKNKLNLNWEGIAISSSGKYQTSVDEGKHIYISHDYGKNWKNTNVQSNWTAICISDSGKYQTALANGFFPTDKGKGFIYISDNYGKNWNKKTDLSVSWVCLAMSSSGKYQIAGSFLIQGEEKYHFYDNGYVYNSEDYGNTWVKNNSLSQSWWTCASMSGTGEIQLICAINCNLDIVPPGPIFISYDYGKNFNRVITPKEEPWLTLCMSKSGKYMLAASYKQQDKDKKDIPNTGGMICSHDYGKTWKYTNAPRTQFTSVAINHSGSCAMATAWDDGIYKLFQ